MPKPQNLKGQTKHDAIDGDRHNPTMPQNSSERWARELTTTHVADLFRTERGLPGHWEREGIRRKDDTLPPRILYDPLPDGTGQGKVMGDKTFNKMLDEYYSLRGWDSNGVPLPETLQRLGLTEIVGDLPE